MFIIVEHTEQVKRAKGELEKNVIYFKEQVKIDTKNKNDSSCAGPCEMIREIIMCFWFYS